jgi:hypothetical protein
LIPRPNPAPAWEYIAIPEGSSFDAPVMRPGPKNLRASHEFIKRSKEGQGIAIEISPKYYSTWDHSKQ